MRSRISFKQGTGSWKQFVFKTKICGNEGKSQKSTGRRVKSPDGSGYSFEICNLWLRNRWWKSPERYMQMARSLSWMSLQQLFQAEERDKLFSVIRGLKEKGHSIIFISHHLDELMEIW